MRENARSTQPRSFSRNRTARPEALDRRSARRHPRGRSRSAYARRVLREADPDRVQRTRDRTPTREVPEVFQERGRDGSGFAYYGQKGCLMTIALPSIETSPSRTVSGFNPTSGPTLLLVPLFERASQTVLTGVLPWDKYPLNRKFSCKSGPVSELALSDSGPRFPTSVLAAARMGTPAPLRVAFGFRVRSSNDDRSRRPRLRRARRLKGDVSNRPSNGPSKCTREMRPRNSRGSLSSRSVGAH